MGIPVVGAMESEMPGMFRVECNGHVDANDLTSGVAEVLSRYPEYVMECKEQRELLSWEVVVSRMLMEYTSHLKISQRDLILSDYKNIPIRSKKIEENGYYYWFKGSPHFYKGSRPHGGGNAVIFRDRLTGSIKGTLNTPKDKRSWTTVPDDPKKYIEWEILVQEGSKVLDRIIMDLRDQHVLVKMGELMIDQLTLSKFAESTGCILSIDKSINLDFYLPQFRYSGSDDSNFYRVLNTDQILDYFQPKEKLEDKVAIVLRSRSLGDSISFIPYAEEYAKRRGIVCHIDTNHPNLFDGKCL